MFLMKNGQNMNQEIFHYVPVQDLSEKWTDVKLYKKYNIQQSEIKFINSVIKERN